MRAKVVWMTGGKKYGPNYGDVLTPYVLDHMKINYTHASGQKPDAIGIGSLLGIPAVKLGMMNNCRVLGSGLIDSNDVDKLLPHHYDYRWVRGPFTAKLLRSKGFAVPNFYGDAALLISEIWEESEKEYDVGIVPHMVDYDIVCKQYPDMRVINIIGNDCERTTREITQCRKIISTSLHGIIAAHAYGIPAAWVPSINGIMGDDIKFYDHHASVGLEAIKSTFEKPVYQAPKNPVDLTNIKEAFRYFKEEFE